MSVDYRHLAPFECEKLWDIDRSEIIDEIYHLRVGKLVLKKEHYDMKGFPPGELDKIIERQKILLENGGTVIGALDGPTLVGVASLENRFRGEKKKYMKMDILFVSRDYRGTGIAKTLVDMICDRAREFGAGAVYISATPSRHTVDFYMDSGAKLAEEPDKELLELEPDDIHLEILL